MKRHESLATLSSDHQHGLNIARMLSHSKPEEAEDAFIKLKEFFEKELTGHFSE